MLRGDGFNFQEEMRIVGDRFYIGSRRRRKERFNGLIRQVKFYSGLSIQSVICNENQLNPNLAEVPNRLSISRDTQVQVPLIRFEVDNPKHVACSSKVKGHMLYGRDSKISVCDGLGWISITKGRLLA